MKLFALTAQSVPTTVLCPQPFHQFLLCERTIFRELPYIVHVSGTPQPEKQPSDSKENDTLTSAFAPISHALGVRLVDPNTKTELNKTTEIVKYLRVSFAPVRS